MNIHSFKYALLSRSHHAPHVFNGGKQNKILWMFVTPFILRIENIFIFYRFANKTIHFQ